MLQLYSYYYIKGNNYYERVVIMIIIAVQTQNLLKFCISILHSFVVYHVNSDVYLIENFIVS